MDKQAKICVIGYTGQIGSALTSQLVNSGYEHIVTPSHHELDFIKQKEVDSFFKKEKPEYVFFCAGSLGNIDYLENHQRNVIYNNIMMQTNAIKAAGDHGSKKFLYIGSGSVYGRNLISPFSEEHSIESIQNGGMEPYAIAKLVGLEMCKQFDGYNGCKYLSVLPTHIYGTKNTSRKKYNLIESTMRCLHEAKKENLEHVSLDIWGTGTKCIRQFIYIDDIVDALLYFMENYTENTPVNIATDEAVSLDEMVKIVASVVAYHGSISYQYEKPENCEQRLLSTERMKSLGWQPKFSLYDGIRDLYDLYCHNL